jgi:hypothetical protein|tara:strand:+ start:15752 stop:15967 length:216 start_codon:yes stop_codon:yes gene_type:complete
MGSLVVALTLFGYSDGTEVEQGRYKERMEGGLRSADGQKEAEFVMRKEDSTLGKAGATKRSRDVKIQGRRT